MQYIFRNNLLKCDLYMYVFAIEFCLLESIILNMWVSLEISGGVVQKAPQPPNRRVVSMYMTSMHASWSINYKKHLMQRKPWSTVLLENSYNKKWICLLDKICFSKLLWISVDYILPYRISKYSDSNIHERWINTSHIVKNIHMCQGAYIKLRNTQNVIRILNRTK